MLADNAKTKHGQMTGPASTHLSSPDNAAPPRANAENEVLTQKVQKVQNVPGYKTPTFTGKDLQRQQVVSHVSSKGFMPKDLVPIEVGWFYNNLAIDDSYFQSETVEAISNHILALYGAKLQAFTRNDPESIIIDLEKVTDASMVFIHTSAPGQPALTGPGATCERRIDDRIDKSTPQEAFRLETYRSAGSISATASQQLRCYFVSKCQWVSPPTDTPIPHTENTSIRDGGQYHIPHPAPLVLIGVTSFGQSISRTCKRKYHTGLPAHHD
jgi:glutamate dehydrogenase